MLGLAATFHPFHRTHVVRRVRALVGIGSVAAIRGLPGHGAYCASKAAVISYCESLRGEMRGRGCQGGHHLPWLYRHAADTKNRYAMPFLMQPDVFADKAFRCDRRWRNSYRVIPWQMGVGSQGSCGCCQTGLLTKCSPDATQATRKLRVTLLR
jgi:short-subunit dehydrogenase